jgi:hypothetical protein
MRNDHEKTRDMARSLLPSNLTVKQWRRQIHHRERSRVRAELHRASFTDPADAAHWRRSARTSVGHPLRGRSHLPHRYT